MPDGYPKFEKKGANNYITIAIPVFNHKAEYDLIVEPGENPNNAVEMCASTTMLLIVSLLLAFSTS